MSYEILRQPQVFAVKLSALGGIEGYVPPYITEFYTWTIPVLSDGYTFNLVGGPGLNHETNSSYIVNINSDIIPPPFYSVNPDFRTITFDNLIQSGRTIYVTQVGSIALTATSYAELTAGKLLVTQGLTAKGDFFVEDTLHLIQPRADSGFRDTGISNLSDGNFVVRRNNDNGSYKANMIVGYKDGSMTLTDPVRLADTVRIDTVGNVGINTSSPSRTLDVNGSFNVSTNSGSISFLNGADINFGYPPRGSAISNRAFVADLNNTLTVNYDNDFTGGVKIGGGFNGTGTNTGTIFTSAGYVGLGKQNPYTKLDVGGAITLRAETLSNIDPGVNDYSVINLNNRTNVYAYLPGVADTGTSDWAYLRNIGTPDFYHLALDLHDNGARTAVGGQAFSIRNVQSFGADPDIITTRLTIDELGEVGINTPTPTALLHVDSGTDIANRFLQTTSNATSPSIIQSATTQYIDTATSFEVTDPNNTFLSSTSDSHNIKFERKLPTNRPVNYWYIPFNTPTSVFNLVGGPTLTSSSASYIVIVGGAIQPPSEYTINTVARTITFASTLPAEALYGNYVYVLQVVNPTLASGYDFSTTLQSVTASRTGALTYPLTGFRAPLQSNPNRYLVSVDGLYQIPTASYYTINTSLSTITFVAPNIPKPNLPITIVQLPAAISLTGPLEDACYLSSFTTWTVSSPTPYSTYTLTGTNLLLSDPNSYIVNVGGVIQVPRESYVVNPLTRVITFTNPVPGNVDVSITMLAAPEFPTKYSTVFNIVDDCVNTSTGDAEEVVRLRPGSISIAGSIATAPPITVTTTTFTAPFSASSLIFNTAGTTTVTLPRASQHPGRWLNVKNIAAQTINSASPNIVPISTATPGNLLLTNAAGRWAKLQSDGTYWIVMEGN